MFDMWKELPPQTREQSAMVVGPWNHSMNVHVMPEEDIRSLGLDDGNIPQDEVTLRWFEHIRGKGQPTIAEPGRVKYYQIGNGWKSAKFIGADAYKTLYLSADGGLSGAEGAPQEITYTYNPDDPAYFPGGQDAFNTQPTGLVRQLEPNFRPDVHSFVSEPAPRAYSVEGELEATLTVKTDCADTAFFVRVSVVTAEAAWVLRDTIFSLDHETVAIRPVRRHLLRCGPRRSHGRYIRVTVSASMCRRRTFRRMLPIQIQRATGPSSARRRLRKIQLYVENPILKYRFANRNNKKIHIIP